MAQDIWPAAGQISNNLYDRWNYVTSQRCPVMTSWPVITGPIKAGYLTGYCLKQL